MPRNGTRALKSAGLAIATTAALLTAPVHAQEIKENAAGIDCSVQLIIDQSSGKNPTIAYLEYLLCTWG